MAVELELVSGSLPDDLDGVALRVGPNESPEFGFTKRLNAIIDGDGIRLQGGTSKTALYSADWLDTPRRKFVEQQCGREISISAWLACEMGRTEPASLAKTVLFAQVGITAACVVGRDVFIATYGVPSLIPYFTDHILQIFGPAAKAQYTSCRLAPPCYAKLLVSDCVNNNYIHRIMDNKRKSGGFDLNAARNKMTRLDQQTAQQRPQQPSASPYLRHPVNPKHQIHAFLTQARAQALKYSPDQPPFTKSFCEIEARLGILTVPFSVPARRVTSSGAKRVQGKLAHAFLAPSQSKSSPIMKSGISSLHFQTWLTLSETSGLTQALGARAGSDSKAIRQLIKETPLVETVYVGYPQERRCTFPGIHTATSTSTTGSMEYKEKLVTSDLIVPAAAYDTRINISSEKIVDHNIGNQPPVGWSQCRVKRRKSYSRVDQTIGWQIDVTQVTTTTRDGTQPTSVDYELEMELIPSAMLALLNETDPAKVSQRTKTFADQLWWILSSLNPLEDPLDIEETLEDHPDTQAVQLATAHCGALRHFMERGGGRHGGALDSPLTKPENLSRWSTSKFMGCMPVNFSRHDLETIQRESDQAYYMSEKTDGVRYLMVFTGKTVVLLDRKMRGKRPKVPKQDGAPRADPFEGILPLIQPGTVFDGEVVMNRRESPRPIFIVFDVLCINATQPVLQLNFDQRLQHLKKASFRTPTANRNMFDESLVANLKVPLPLVRKNFVVRTQVDSLLSKVHQERGMRIYQNGPVHNHLTDGIIFQPNSPYVCGTDTRLLKWKYLDTATVDVEILPLESNDEDDVLRVACMGEEQTRVDMTRYVKLPPSECYRLAADRHAAAQQRPPGRNVAEIAEVGFNPETGDWYYLTMRDDKVAPNHISTVLGTMLELAESLNTDELRYRMSVPSNTPDTYRKDVKGMMRQMLAHQRNTLKNQHRP